MEELETLDEEVLAKPNKRPVFILVLAILSWTASFFTVLNSVYTLATAETQRANFEDSMDILDGFGGGGFMHDAMEMAAQSMQYLELQAWVGLIGALLIAVFVILMFNLKKVGFYGYTAVSVGLFTYPLFLYSMGGMILMIYSLGVMFSIGFIIMYGVNLKHMK